MERSPRSLFIRPSCITIAMFSVLPVAAQTITTNWVVENVREYKAEVIDDTAIIGNHVPTDIGAASAIGEMTLLSELSKVFSEDSIVSIPKSDLKVTKGALKLPNMGAGVVKDGLESIITLDELIKARDSASTDRLRSQIDNLMTEAAKGFSEDWDAFDNAGTVWDGSLLAKHKETLKSIPTSDGHTNLYNRINVKLQNLSVEDYKKVAQKLDGTMEQYRSEVGYQSGKKLSSYSNHAKPKVKFLKVAKGITSALAGAGDLISFALDIALMAQEEPDQYVYVGAAAANTTTANQYADSIIREALAIEMVKETYKARTEAIAKAIQVLNPIFLPESEFLYRNESRWTNLVWVLNEKALLQELDSGQIIYGGYTQNGPTTQSYVARRLSDKVEPLSGELHAAKYAVKQSSTLVAMLGTAGTGNDYDPREKNTVAATAFSNHVESVRSDLRSKPTQESFSWALSQYFTNVDDLVYQVEQFKSYSTMYKTAVYWAFYEAANSDLTNQDMAYLSQQSDAGMNTLYTKALALRNEYESLLSSQGVEPSDTTQQILRASNILLEDLLSSLERLTDLEIVHLLETIETQANSETYGDREGWYQLFQRDNESSEQHTRRLAGHFRYAIGEISSDSTTSIDTANALMLESIVAADDIASNWIASDVFKVKGNYYTPLGAMDQIVFETATGGNTDYYANRRVINTVGQEVYAHEYFFDVLNHPRYRSFLKKKSPKYPHFRGWYGTETNKYTFDMNIIGKPLPTWELIDLSDEKLVNQAVMPISWRRWGGRVTDTATFGMPLPTKENSDSIGKVTADSVMSVLGEGLRQHYNTNKVTNSSDLANSIHDYEDTSKSGYNRPWRWYTWNDGWE
ncbi:hypothetical protein IX95_26145 [Vibrio sp. B183]|uniref:hypothetical protein n=1 Tax=Vibrio sp. B183 TaxID=1526762 RepID=UPI000503E547|nr:hypothetical protein [Vibrio sp. B183]KFI09113.1 hypothetical protein IX95_26145 [Vibrio sp. B183]